MTYVAVVLLWVASAYRINIARRQPDFISLTYCAAAVGITRQVGWLARLGPGIFLGRAARGKKASVLRCDARLTEACARP